jgi:hypothetical protein
MHMHIDHITLDHDSPQLYVAGLPWRRQTEIRSQRNNLNELGRYLERTFPDKYMVFNLVPFEVSERTRFCSSSDLVWI